MGLLKKQSITYSILHTNNILLNCLNNLRVFSALNILKGNHQTNKIHLMIVSIFSSLLKIKLSKQEVKSFVPIQTKAIIFNIKS